MSCYSNCSLDVEICKSNCNKDNTSCSRICDKARDVCSNDCYEKGSRDVLIGFTVGPFSALLVFLLVYFIWKKHKKQKEINTIKTNINSREENNAIIEINVQNPTPINNQDEIIEWNSLNVQDSRLQGSML
jgi:hypothetical protein